MYGQGYGGYGAPRGGRGYGVDVNGDGIPDYKVKPSYGGARVVPGPGMGRGGYGYRGY